MAKTIAILMPALNEEKSAAITLDSIFKSTRLPDEIIVADGGSQDKTIEIVEQYKDKGVDLKIVHNPEVFAGAGRNYAFSESKSDILMLMDFGNTATPDWIEKMAAPFENTNTDFVSGAFIPETHSVFEHCVACILYYNNSLMDKMPIQELMKQMPKDHSPGALSLAVSRNMWERVGGMPNWLRAAEDKLFGRKMMTFSPKYSLLPEAKIKHHMRSNVFQVFNQMKTYSRGNGRTRLFDNYNLKLFFIYFATLLGLVGTFFSAYFVFPLLLFFIVYFWKSGISKVLNVDGKLTNKRVILYASGIVLFRDLGVLNGISLGIADWYLIPKFRKKFAQYTRDTALSNKM